MTFEYGLVLNSAFINKKYTQTLIHSIIVYITWRQ